MTESRNKTTERNDEHRESVRRQRRALLAGLACAGIAYMAPGIVSVNEAQAHSRYTRPSRPSHPSRYERRRRYSRYTGPTHPSRYGGRYYSRYTGPTHPGRYGGRYGEGGYGGFGR